MTPLARFVAGLVLWGLLIMASYAAAMMIVWHSQCGQGQAC